MNLAIFSPEGYQFSILAIAVFQVSAAVGLLSLQILVSQRLSRISACFSLIGLSLTTWQFCFAWMYSTHDANLALFWAKLGYLTIPFIPAAFYIFSLCMAPGVTQKRARVLTVIGISTCFMLLAQYSDHFIRDIHRYSWGFYPIYGPIGRLFILYFVLLVTASLIHFSTTARTAQKGSPERRLTIALMATFFVAYTGGIDFLAKYGFNVPPLGFIPVLIFTLMAIRIIYRYHLGGITPSLAAPTILSTMNDALFVLDHRGIIQLTNQAAAKLFGRPEKAILNRSLASLFHETTDSPATIKTFLQGDGPHHREVTVRLSDSRTVYLELSIAKTAADTYPQASICMAHDITARILAEQELLEIQEKLEEQVAERTSRLEQAHEKLLQTEKLCAVGKLSASIAHEFGSPIFAIRNLFSSMKQPHGGPVNPELLELGIKECERLQNLLRNLQDFYQPTVKAMKKMDFNQLITDIAMLYKKSLEMNHIHLKTVLLPDLPLFFGSESQLKQVLINLLSNAMDATAPTGGEITIITDHHANRITIAISDTGPGINEDILDHIFEPFVTSKDEKIGTGLGLSISYGIIAGHGGELIVASTSEHGTTFLIDLPFK